MLPSEISQQSAKDYACRGMAAGKGKTCVID